MLGISAFIALYVVISGLHGIYSTDKIQLSALIVALVLVSYRAIQGGDFSLAIELESFRSNLDLSLILTLIIPGFFAVVGAADVHQRIISAASERDLRNIAFASTAGWFVLGILLVLFSSGVIRFGGSDIPGFIGFLSAIEGPIRVIIIVALVSALLSTADTESHAIALLLNRAVRPTEKPSVRLSRFLIVGICAVGAIIALSFKALTTLYSILLNISLILGPIILAILFQRGSRLSVLVTILISTALLVFYALSDLWLGTAHFQGIQVLLLCVPTLINLTIRGSRD